MKFLLILGVLISFNGFADSQPGDIDFDSYFDMDDYRGQTYLNFMQTSIKPAMDTLATDGYAVCDAKAIKTAYGAVAPKIKSRVDRSFGGLDNVLEIAAQLEGETVNLTNLPNKLRAVDSSADVYDLATFIGLACGGGVKIRYADGNFGLNVHYDTTEQRSGRSFGVGPTRAANDASDKEYLNDLEEYTRGSSDNLPEFYTALFQSLLNSDGSNYVNVNEDGQTVLTDFLSVFTAEQARNLMDDEVSPHWDAALLEVTLLAAFHAGQSKIKLFYKDPGSGETSFTDTTLKQTPCATPTTEQPAHLRDYWQFSRNIDDPRNCKRSGINITKTEFRKLGQLITQYMSENYPEQTEAVAKAIGSSLRTNSNLFRDLSYYLISDRLPEKLSAKKVSEITKAWVALLELSTQDAKAITKAIEKGE